MEKAICTLCAGIESPGFYHGCLIKDGQLQSEWQCNGNGNLTKPDNKDNVEKNDD